MKYTDPTYLRTIHDGLVSGTFHKDNASALPEGLIGIYEDALPSANHVKERQKFLEFFSAWALLKKEVSIDFVASLLGWPEEQVLDYIARYSKWFNAPTSGKYVLYHERLRSFVLQKISHNQFSACNETIIKLGQDALENRSGDEWEYYALEHLSTHLLIHTMEKGNADALKSLAYNAAHWNRQVEISKGFEWSKRLLNDMMLWASKYDDEEVIECVLNKVDLYHQEQNDAPRIVELVAQNDIDIALRRIEAFGGNDEEGNRRKFTLYMLCLMKLTLLHSKDKPFRKEATEKLLNHLVEHVQSDISLLDWSQFFPHKIVLFICFELAKLGLDFKILFKYSNGFHIDWISQIKEMKKSDIKVLFECVNLIIDPETRFDIQILLSGQYSYLLDIDDLDFISNEALKSAILVDSLRRRCFCLINVAKHYFSLNNKLMASKILDDSIIIARKIEDEIERQDVLIQIHLALSYIGKRYESEILRSEITGEEVDPTNYATVCFEDESWLETEGRSNFQELEKVIDKDIVIKEFEINEGEIDAWLQKYNDLLSDIEIESSINSNLKVKIIFNIISEKITQGKIVEAKGIISNLKVCFWGNEASLVNVIVSYTINELVNQNYLSDAIDVLSTVSDIYTRKDAIVPILQKLVFENRLQEALDYTDLEHYSLEPILNALIDIDDYDTAIIVAEKSTKEHSALMNKLHIAMKLSCIGRYDESFKICMLIYEKYKNMKYSKDSSENNDINEILKCLVANLVMNDNFDLAGEITSFIEDKAELINLYNIMSRYLASKGKIEEAMELVKKIDDKVKKSITMREVAILSSKKAEFKKVIEICNLIDLKEDRQDALGRISMNMAIAGEYSETIDLLDQIMEVAQVDSWKYAIAKKIICSKGSQAALDMFYFKKEVLVNTSYLLGIAEELQLQDINKEYKKYLLLTNKYNEKAMKIILTKYIIYNLILDRKFFLKKKKYSHLLNIKWAIDIKNAINVN